MSFKDGMAAICLEMPDKVPRTEYSADFHWELVSKVTGIEVDSKSPSEIQNRAASAFRREWDYGFVWNTLIGADALDSCRTRMGHAEYAAGRNGLQHPCGMPLRGSGGSV